MERNNFIKGLREGEWGAADTLAWLFHGLLSETLFTI